jgi:hypothetical protein
MTDDAGRADRGAEANAEPEDLGDPILELRSLEEEVSEGFMARVLSSLRRRSLVSQMATMVWTASAQAFFEFIGMFFSLFDPGRSTRGGSD